MRLFYICGLYGHYGLFLGYIYSICCSMLLYCSMLYSAAILLYAAIFCCYAAIYILDATSIFMLYIFNIYIYIIYTYIGSARPDAAQVIRDRKRFEIVRKKGQKKAPPEPGPEGLFSILLFVLAAASRSDPRRSA